MKHIDKRTAIAALLGALSALVVTIGGVALAHGGPPGGPHGRGGAFHQAKMDAFLEEMIESLDLSPAQEQQIRAIAEGAKSQAEEIETMPRSKEKLLAFRDLHFATEDQIYANLSCEQREELRLLKREHKAARMQQHFERHHALDP